MKNIIKVNQNNFQQEVLESPTPIAVVFLAPWCKPCQTYEAIINEIASHGVRFAVVNTDSDGTLVQDYDILSVPTTLIFRDGKAESEQLVGLKSMKEVLQAIKLN